MIYIFIDANFMLVPAQFKVNIYEEFERLVPKPYRVVIISAIFTELELKIEKSPAKTKLNGQYRFSRQLLENYPHEIVKKERPPRRIVDDFLLDEAVEWARRGHKIYLATNDRELRRKCLGRGIRTIYLRQKKFLATEEE